MIKILFILIVFPIALFSQNFQQQKIEQILSKVNDKANYVKLNEEDKMQLCTNLYNLSKEIGYKKGMLIAQVKQIQIYFTKAETNSALRLIADAFPIAKELDEYYFQSYLIEIKARALEHSKNYDESRKNFYLALQLANQIENKDTLHYKKVSIYTGLADFSQRVFEEMNYTNYNDSTIYYGHKAYEEALKIQVNTFEKFTSIGSSSQFLACAYNNLGDLENAGKFLDIAEEAQLKSYYPLKLAGLYTYRGNFELKKNNEEKALEYFYKSLKISKENNIVRAELNVYPSLIEYFKNKGDIEKQLYYTEKFSNLNDSLATINQLALITQNEIDNQAKDKARNSNLWKWIIACGVTTALIGFLFFYLNKKRRKTQEYLQIPEENTVDYDELANLMDLAKNNDKHFLLAFQETFPDLYQKLLEFSELTPSDMELCAFLKLNLQTKEIATYRKTTVGAVDNRKYRLRKKLDLTPEINLYNWINTL